MGPFQGFGRGQDCLGLRSCQERQERHDQHSQSVAFKENLDLHILVRKWKSILLFLQAIYRIEGRLISNTFAINKRAKKNFAMRSTGIPGDRLFRLKVDKMSYWRIGRGKRTFF